MARFSFEADTVRAEGLEKLGRPMWVSASQ